jgi:hypothetical protein
MNIINHGNLGTIGTQAVSWPSELLKELTLDKSLLTWQSLRRGILNQDRRISV